MVVWGLLPGAQFLAGPLSRPHRSGRVLQQRQRWRGFESTSRGMAVAVGLGAEEAEDSLIANFSTDHQAGG